MAEGKWDRALVTGASSGIGRAFAEALARRGTDLVVVARDTGRLDDLAKALGHECGVGVEVLAADLTDPVALERVAERAASRQDACDVVVNNAGLGFSGSFVASGAGAALTQVDLNVRAVVRLTHAALARMTDVDEGAVLNVASAAGFFPAPGDVVYAATKAFVINLGLGLAEELRSAGSAVRVSTLCPGFTRTEFQERGGFDTRGVPGLLWDSADEVARAGLGALEGGRSLVVPGVPNRASALASHAVPRTLQARLVSVLSRRLRSR